MRSLNPENPEERRGWGRMVDGRGHKLSGASRVACSGSLRPVLQTALGPQARDGCRPRDRAALSVGLPPRDGIH